VFFTRLIMKADDFGRFHANPKLLASFLFPLKAYDVGYIASALTECQRAGLFVIYVVDGKDYLEIKDFGQRLRNMRSKFPEPERIKEPQQFADNPPPLVIELRTNVSESPSIDSNPPPETETEVETESESETEAGKESAPTLEEIKNLLFGKGEQRWCDEMKRLYGAWGPDEFDKCYQHHNNGPAPPVALWQWRQKFGTWLSIKLKNENEQRTKTKRGPGQNASQGDGQPRQSWKNAWEYSPKP